MGRLTRKARCDVFFYPAVYSFFPLLSRVPCVVCYHDTTAERLPQYVFPTKRNHRLWQLKTTLAKLQTTRAMTVSQSSASDVEQILGIRRERIDVITEAADPVFRVLEDPALASAERETHGVPASAVLLVYVGGLNPHKNLLGLLQAMPDVIASQPDTHLAIVGDTSGRGFWDNVGELKEFVRTHPPLEQHVHFTGYLDDQRLVALLNGASALVFPSLWEGFGLPAVEAMSCGVPVLASQCSSLPEVVGDAGMFFDPASPASIARCLIDFLDGRERWPILRAAAVRRAQGFSWERAAELAEQSFRRAAGRPFA
jgi:alpha-1,3-rhamnosyl/mannosyltransferase